MLATRNSQMPYLRLTEAEQAASRVRAGRRRSVYASCHVGGDGGASLSEEQTKAPWTIRPSGRADVGSTLVVDCATREASRAGGAFVYS